MDAKFQSVANQLWLMPTDGKPDYVSLCWVDFQPIICHPLSRVFQTNR